ncbi:MAG: hypothetical protein ACTSPD_14105 [Promethearchaeota archaeon]
MRKKIITFILLLLSIVMLALGIFDGQMNLINGFYEQMARIP